MKIFLLFLLSLLPLGGEIFSQEKLAENFETAKSLENKDQAQKASQLWQDALNFSSQREQALALSDEYQKESKQLENLPALTLPILPNTSAELAEQLTALETVSSAIDANQMQLDKLTTEADQSTVRSATLATLISSTKEQLASLNIPPLSGGELDAATHQRAQHQQAFLEATLAQYLAEQKLLKSRAETLPQRLKQRNEHLEILSKLQQRLRELITKLRAEKAADTRQTLADAATKAAHIPKISKLIDEIKELNERELQPRINQANQYQEEIERIRERIQDQEESAKQRITLLEGAQIGIDTETGILLREQRRRLPSTGELSRQLDTQVKKTAQAQIEKLKINNKIISPPTFSARLFEAHPELQQEFVNSLLAQRSELLSKLSEDYRLLSESLTKGSTLTKLTIAEIKEYSTFLDQRLLWIRSTQPISLQEPRAEWRRLTALFSPSRLSQATQSLLRNLPYQLFTTSLFALLFLIPLFRYRQLSTIASAGNQAAIRRNCTSILPTLKAGISLILLAFSIPSLILGIAFLIHDTASHHIGLRNLGIFLFISLLLYQFTHANGFLVSHFKFPSEHARLIHRNLLWLIPISSPLVFAVGALTLSGQNTTSGRLVFMISMIPVLWWTHRFLHPSRSILQSPNTKPTAFIRITYLLGIIIPLVFLIASALGYFSSVLTLRTQIGATLALMVLGFLTIRFFNRWILVSRRRLAIAQALRRREAIVAEREKEEHGETDTDLPSLEELKAEAIDVVEVEEQTTRLVRLSVYLTLFFGIWGIWHSTLPALTALDKIHLWGEEPAQTSTPSTSPQTPSLIPELSSALKPANEVAKITQPSTNFVSLQDLLLSIIFFALTFSAAKNIPGLLSLTLFNRLNLGHGGNFAFTTTARYLIIFVGIVLALGKIDITWGKVQWLAAAITLGIGFGLQEIFANFVAGIILLFERPIRLGDVVTVGNVSGKVTQIKIRATTIRQFNSRELLVPNKEFITNQLVNWTLSDQILRFEIPIGVAYGSDTDKVTKELNTLLNNHPLILKDPAPQVLFQNFGNSTLDFEIRGHVGDISHLLQTQNELRYAIDTAFRKAEIEIAFPQQDIHIRSLPETKNSVISTS